MEKKLFYVLIQNQIPRLYSSKSYIEKLKLNTDTIFEFQSKEDAQKFINNFDIINSSQKLVKYTEIQVQFRQIQPKNKNKLQEQIRKLLNVQLQTKKRKIDEEQEGISARFTRGKYYVLFIDGQLPKIYKQRASIIKAGYTLEQVQIYKSDQRDTLVDDIIERLKKDGQIIESGNQQNIDTMDARKLIKTMAQTQKREIIDKDQNDNKLLQGYEISKPQPLVRQLLRKNSDQSQNQQIQSECTQSQQYEEQIQQYNLKINEKKQKPKSQKKRRIKGIQYVEINENQINLSNQQDEKIQQNSEDLEIIQKQYEQIWINYKFELRWYKINDMFKKNSQDADMQYLLNFDGSTALSTQELNSWQSACAFSIKLEEKVIFDVGIYVGNTKSNGAEFLGLIYGLITSFELGIRNLQIYGDSQIVINIMNYRFQPRDPSIIKYSAIAFELKKLFKIVQFTHIPREMNKHTDFLAKRKREEFVQLIKRQQNNSS